MLGCALSYYIAVYLQLCLCQHPQLVNIADCPGSPEEAPADSGMWRLEKRIAAEPGTHNTRIPGRGHACPAHTQEQPTELAERGAQQQGAERKGFGPDCHVCSAHAEQQLSGLEVCCSQDAAPSSTGGHYR